jgi:hypothetical protein
MNMRGEMFSGKRINFWRPHADREGPFFCRSSIDQKIRCFVRDLKMTTDDSKEDITAMAATEMSTATTYPQFDPLDINCELALSFIVDYIRSENFPSGIQLPDLTTLPNSIFLDKIAEMLLIPALTECISIAFYPILPVIVGRWAMSGDQVERIACAFGRILFLEPKLKR